MIGTESLMERIAPDVKKDASMGPCLDRHGKRRHT